MSGLLPWESVAPGALPFIYPRTVSVLRFPAPTQVGQTGYGGLASGQQGQIDPANWPAVLTGLPASIQTHRIGSTPEEKLPADARGKATWRIFIPYSAAAPGQIMDRDAVQDDLGRLFHVIAAYTNSLGWDLYSEILET